MAENGDNQKSICSVNIYPRITTVLKFVSVRESIFYLFRHSFASSSFKKTKKKKKFSAQYAAITRQL